MTRKKVKLVWISNDSARKASLKKRRLGLLKKVRELTVLCGVEAFIVIYSPDEADPMTWPPSRTDVERLIMRYMSMPEIERCKKLTNQESYLKERMGKVHEQIKKSNKKNKDTELSYFMFHVNLGKGLDNFELNELQGLAWLVDDRMKELRKRINYFKMVPPLNERRRGGSEDSDVDMGGGGSETLQGKMVQNPNEPMSWDQWFVDMVHNSETNGAGGGNIGAIGGSEMDIQYAPQGFGPYGSVHMGFDQFQGNVGAGMTMYPPELGGQGYSQFSHADMVVPPPPPLYHGGAIGGGVADMGMNVFYGENGGGGAGHSGIVDDGMELTVPYYDANDLHWLNNPS